MNRAFVTTLYLSVKNISSSSVSILHFSDSPLPDRRAERTAMSARKKIGTKLRGFSKHGSGT